jgi:hypothetical protein
MGLGMGCGTGEWSVYIFEKSFNLMAGTRLFPVRTAVRNIISFRTTIQLSQRPAKDCAGIDIPAANC